MAKAVVGYKTGALIERVLKMSAQREAKEDRMCCTMSAQGVAEEDKATEHVTIYNQSVDIQNAKDLGELQCR